MENSALKFVSSKGFNFLTSTKKILDEKTICDVENAVIHLNAARDFEFPTKDLLIPSQLLSHEI